MERKPTCIKEQVIKSAHTASAGFYFIYQWQGVISCSLPYFILRKVVAAMTENAFSRTQMLLTDEALERITNSHIAVFGIGGVGGHAAEALVRAGVGELTFVDFDTISITNLNRQIIALRSTVGKYKADVMRDRALDINPDAIIHSVKLRYCDDTREELLTPNYDFIIDAIDTVTHKIDLICTAHERSIPIISAMGTGNKLDASAFGVTDIAKTQNCPLARIMRKELRYRGILHHPVVFSSEEPLCPHTNVDNPDGLRKNTPGSVSWVPGCAGMIMAGHAIRTVAGI